LAEITNLDGVQISSVLFVDKAKAIGSKDRRSPRYPFAGSPHWHPAIQIPMYARTSQECG